MEGHVFFHQFFGSAMDSIQSASEKQITWIPCKLSSLRDRERQNADVTVPFSRWSILIIKTTTQDFVIDFLTPGVKTSKTAFGNGVDYDIMYNKNHFGFSVDQAFCPIIDKLISSAPTERTIVCFIFPENNKEN